MPRRAGRLALSMFVAACASPPGDPDAPLPDYVMRERVAAVAVGQPYDDARALLGDTPVIRPGHPEQPYPTPLRELTLGARDGAEVHVEVYVVATRPAEGCPDVHFEDVPVVFVDGVVAQKGWDALERRWRGWGGSLEALRSVQERRLCEPGRQGAAP